MLFEFNFGRENQRFAICATNFLKICNFFDSYYNWASFLKLTYEPVFLEDLKITKPIPLLRKNMVKKMLWAYRPIESLVG